MRYGLKRATIVLRVAHDMWVSLKPPVKIGFLSDKRTITHHYNINAARVAYTNLHVRYIHTRGVYGLSRVMGRGKCSDDPLAPLHPSLCLPSPRSHPNNVRS